MSPLLIKSLKGSSPDLYSLYTSYLTLIYSSLLAFL
jgi:hypothetical protein